MYRIDNATSTSSLPTPAVPGPNPDSYFTKGVPGSIPATIVDQDWANAVQEELCGVIEAAGLTLNKSSQSQLLAAIRLVASSGAGTYAASTSAANTYTATLSPAPSAYAAGMTVFIKFTNANSGASTLNLNGLGAKSIKDATGAALVSGNIQASMIGVFTYNGTDFQMINPYQGSSATSLGVQNSTYNSATDTGSANTYTAILSPVPSYGAGLHCTIKITNTNTGASSLNLNSLGAVNIKTLGGNDPKAGMLLAGMEAEFFHDGTNFQLLNPNLATTIQNSLYTNVTDTGAANAYVATLSPALTAYVAGMRCIIKVANTNTGASTININSLGTKNIKTLNGADPSAGMLYAGMEADLFYDGTNFQLMNSFDAVAIQNSSWNATATDSGSANAYAASMTPAVTAYAAGQSFTVKIANTNTGASTININSLGAKNIKTAGGLDPKAGMIYAGMEAQFFYDGTNFQIMNPYLSPSLITSAWNYYTDTGAANAYVITASPAPSAYVAGMRFSIVIANANTGASTLNVNGLGTKSITKRDLSALSANNLLANFVAEVIYDGTQFQLLNYPTSAGDIILVESKVVSGSANVDFVSIGGYKKYKLIFQNLANNTATNTGLLRFSTDNGSSFLSGASAYYGANNIVSDTSGGAATSSSSTGTNGIRLTSVNGLGSGSLGFRGELNIVGMNESSGGIPTVSGVLEFAGTTPTSQTIVIGSGYLSAINANAIRITASGGTYSGKVSLYGINT